jgi:hypothetical protein
MKYGHTLHLLSMATSGIKIVFHHYRFFNTKQGHCNLYRKSSPNCCKA